MSEDGDYTPASWARSHDFSSARRTYDTHVGRSYAAAKTSGKKAANMAPAKIKTMAENPLLIAVDVTGSMGEWPATIFSKLPYLDHECKTEYLGKDMEIAFMAVGDANSHDTYPLQVQNFGEGEQLKKALTDLIIERGGGGGATETYELAALYALHNVEMPNAIKPIMIFIGDEAFYDTIFPDMAKKHAKVELEQNIRSMKVFRDLMKKFSVYLIRKPYGSGDNNPANQGIYEKWIAALGMDRIAPLPDPNRVVDVIFGILAREMGKKEYFEEELKGRQTKPQVKAVMKSLHSIHTESPPTGTKPKKKTDSKLFTKPKK